MSRATKDDAAPRARRKQAERTALSDRKLTEAAIRLLVERGVQGTTLQAVGELAGYSRGLATHRFGSKGGLFANVLEVASRDWLKRMQKAVGTRTGVEALCAATDAVEKFMRERPDELTVAYITGNGYKTQEVVVDKVTKPYIIEPSIAQFREIYERISK